MDSLSFFVKVVERAMYVILLFGVAFIAVSTFKYLPREVRKVISRFVTMLFFFAFFRESALSFGTNIPKTLFSFVALFCLVGITAVLTYYLSRIKSAFLRLDHVYIERVDSAQIHLLHDFSYTPDDCKASRLKLSPVNLN